MGVRVKTTYLGPTDTEGSRIRVTSKTGIRHIEPFDYSARNAHTAAIRRALWPNYTNPRIRYIGDHARGHWYDVS